ncbi:MAG: ADP-ribosyltransferase domain-containing protein, partial [Saprospiraceae bacterium]
GDKLEFVRGLKAIEGSWKIFLEDAFVISKSEQVIAEELTTKFPYLSVAELTAIKVYTSDMARNGVKIYQSLNTELRMANLSDFNKGLNELLNKGLSKLVPYNGLRVFRGCGELESQIAKKWNVGDFIKFDDFKSSSIYENTAINFMNLGSGDVIYEILNPKGYNICQISCLPGEAEILFKSGSKFKILKTEGLFINIEKVGKKIQLEFIP